MAEADTVRADHYLAPETLAQLAPFELRDQNSIRAGRQCPNGQKQQNGEPSWHPRLSDHQQNGHQEVSQRTMPGRDQPHTDAAQSIGRQHHGEIKAFAAIHLPNPQRQKGKQPSHHQPLEHAARVPWNVQLAFGRLS